jgi:hypothetical protein
MRQGGFLIEKDKDKGFMIFQSDVALLTGYPTERTFPV